MPDVIRTKIEGVAELKTALEGLGTEVATKVGVAANRATAREYQATLKQVAPYDPRDKVQRGMVRPYGHLRDNIKVTRKKARKQGSIVFWTTIGRAFWGFFVERGTERMSAKPWMLPAFERTRENLASLQIDQLRTGIERAAKRLARLRGRG